MPALFSREPIGRKTSELPATFGSPTKTPIEKLMDRVMICWVYDPILHSWSSRTNARQGQGISAHAQGVRTDD